MVMEARSRNAVIDGWRGISVSLVILGHILGYRVPALYPVDALDALGFSLGTRTFNVVTSLGGLGVSFFFAISGYLITSLLVSEETKQSRVSLTAFYVRRVMRIMPAFYFYVGSIYLLHRFGLIVATDTAFVRSSLYVCNFSGFSCSWWLAHTWSLAVEEQFYLAWPLLFVLAAGRRTDLALCLLAAAILGSFFISDIGSFAYILVGVVVALSPWAQGYIARLDGRLIWLLLALLLVLPITSGIPIVRELAHIARPILVAAVLFGTLFGPDGGRLRTAIQHPVLVKIGLVSYSLYLWQQVSLAPAQWGGGATGANQLYQGWGDLLAFAFVPIAIASYVLIEKPLVAIGHRISRQIIARGSKSASEPAKTAA